MVKLLLSRAAPLMSKRVNETRPLPMKYHGPHEHDEADEAGQGHGTDVAHYEMRMQQLHIYGFFDGGAI